MTIMYSGIKALKKQQFYHRKGVFLKLMQLKIYF